jgi:hypothetical protein
MCVCVCALTLNVRVPQEHLVRLQAAQAAQAVCARALCRNSHTLHTVTPTHTPFPRRLLAARSRTRQRRTAYSSRSPCAVGRQYLCVRAFTVRADCVYVRGHACRAGGSSARVCACQQGTIYLSHHLPDVHVHHACASALSCWRICARCCPCSPRRSSIASWMRFVCTCVVCAVHSRTHSVYVCAYA